MLPPATLGTGARRRRVVASVIGVGLLVAGTVAGDDDHFPVGPMRMFATTGNPDGRVTELQLHGTTADGEQVRIGFASVGLRRADVEGTLPRYRDDPGRLAAIERSWEADNPGRDLVEVRIERFVTDLVDGAVGGTHLETVVRWEPA